MNKIKITDEYDIIRISGGYRLNFCSKEMHFTNTRKGKDQEVHEKYTQHYGVLYQALQGFLRDYVGRYSESLDDIKIRVDEAMKYIADAEKEVPKKWKEVKVVRG